MLNLSKETKITRVSDAVAAGQTAIASAAIDMQGFDGCMFLIAMGSIDATAVTSANIAGCSTSGGSYVDLTGSSISIAADDDNQVAVLDVVKPASRYLKCEISRGTADAAVDGIIAIQYMAKDIPTTHDSTTVVGADFVHNV